MKNSWVRVNKNKPCPICKHPRYCGISEDGKAAICMWVESDKPTRNGGWLHLLDDPIPEFDLPPKAEEPPAINAQRLAARYTNALDYPRIFELANVTGLSPDSIRRLGAGWDAADNAYSFPMRDSWGMPIGIRLRRLLGGCWAVPGSKSGIFIPEERPRGQDVYICEGPTDTAAMLDLGGYAIGRPCCNGGAAQIVQWLRRNNIRRVVIVPDQDRPGWKGATRLANQLLGWNISVKLIWIPIKGVKDLREWKQVGAQWKDIVEATNRAHEYTKGSSKAWQHGKRHCVTTPA